MSDPRHTKALGVKQLVRQKLDTGTDASSHAPLDKEFKRRLKQPEATVAVAAPIPVSTPQLVGMAATPAKIPPVQLGPDRWHKEASGSGGGYIVLSPNHDLSETDQYPPLNSGYLYKASLPSLLDAYNKAVVMTGLMKSPNARVTIEIHGGEWFIGQIIINQPGIDIVGIGNPSLTGQITINQTSDMKIRSINGYCPPAISNGFLNMPPFPDPQQSPTIYKNSFYDCYFYGDNIISLLQRPFYAENCHWIQTSGANGISELVIPLTIQGNPLDAIPAWLKGCTIQSWLSDPDMNAHGPLGRHPGGYAISYSLRGPGPFATGGVGYYLWPTAKLILEDCNIKGSLLINQGEVKHIRSICHGAIPIGTNPGYVYAMLRGQPLFDSGNGYIGDAPAFARFDNCEMNSAQIARASAWDGAYPIGITPATYPGKSLLQFINSVHRCRYDGPAATAFSGIGGGFANATIVDSPTGALAWPAGDFLVNTYGSCPTAVPMPDFYLM